MINPYLNQNDFLETLLNSCNINIEDSSVDLLQGQERDFIKINTVKNITNNEIGFSKDIKRLNISISKGKYGLIIIWNANCLYNDIIENMYSTQKKYIDYIMENNIL